MTKLDTNRPYGTVYGNGPYAFEQDGKCFDHDGNELVEAEAEPKKRGPKTKTDQLAAQLEE